MSVTSKFPLGQLLIEKKIITPQQLEAALKKQKETGGLLGVILLELGFVDEEMVFLPSLAGQMGVEYIHLKDQNVPPQVIQMIPSKFATHYSIVPTDYKNGILTVAMSQPNDVHILDELGLVVRAKINTVLAGKKDILEAIRHYYGVGAETIDEMMGNVSSAQPSDVVQNIEEIESEASISTFINQILLEAYRDKASDIHIEPFEDELKIRYRIDGVLSDAKVPKNIRVFKDAIISRIKILSNLNIAEKRVPQDGRFKVKVGGVDLDFRVSFIPTPYGESVVLRLLNTTDLYSLEQLGLNKSDQKILDDLIKKPNGIVFITGPTGSGKTTTLYSCLSKINTDDKKIITIEDPIEYQLKGITQCQVNPKVGLTFASGLRSMLRHDPDVMMVGEVRDIETAEIAIQVALTGHLVFSTLHTNDAASGVTRLIDMGVEPYLIASTVECFIAQRLIRTLCPTCKTPKKISAADFPEFAAVLKNKTQLTIYEPKGCDACKMTGFRGRDAIYEFLLLNDPIRQLIMERSSSGKIKDAAVSSGMVTLLQAGWEKVEQGITTPSEIIRVTKDDD